MSTIRIFKPNVTSIGYALFLALNAAGVWGGVFPFLPTDFQTPAILLVFFLGQSIVFAFAYLLSALSVWFFPVITGHFLVKVAATPYALGWACLIASIYLDDHALPLVFASGCLLGLGSAAFYMLWQRLFASRDANTGNRDLVVGVVYGTLMYFALYLIPRAVTVFLIPLVFMPLFCLAIVLQTRTIDRNQPMFEDVPREHPHVYRHAIRSLRRSMLSIGTLGFCSGLMRSVAIEDPALGNSVNMLSMGVLFVGAVALLAIWQRKDLRFNPVAAYGIFFPFVAVGFALLPLIGRSFAPPLAAFLYTIYTIMIILMMIQCAQVSRDQGIIPVFVYGVFGFVVYALHDVGFLAGELAVRTDFGGLSPLSSTAITALFLLSIMLFFGLVGFNRLIRATTAESVELGDLRSLQRTGAGTRTTLAAADNTLDEEWLGGLDEAGDGPRSTEDAAEASDSAVGKERMDTEEAQAQPDRKERGRTGRTGRGKVRRPTSVWMDDDESPQFRDRLSKQVEQVRTHYYLSAREAEILELVARGNTVPSIAEQLVVSENTVRTHTKHIYTKLDVHKKQELVELVESFDPAQVQE